MQTSFVGRTHHARYGRVEALHSPYGLVVLGGAGAELASSLLQDSIAQIAGEVGTQIGSKGARATMAGHDVSHKSI